MIDSTASAARTGRGRPTSVCEHRVGHPRDRTPCEDRRPSEGVSASRAMAADRGIHPAAHRRRAGDTGDDAGHARLHLRGQMAPPCPFPPATPLPVPAQAARLQQGPTSARPCWTCVQPNRDSSPPTLPRRRSATRTTLARVSRTSWPNRTSGCCGPPAKASRSGPGLPFPSHCGRSSSRWTRPSRDSSISNSAEGARPLESSPGHAANPRVDRSDLAQRPHRTARLTLTGRL